MADYDMIPCHRCRGTGRVAVTGTFAATLALLRRQKRPANAAALARLAGCRGTAMANRLVWLERHGLARGEWNGRERLWVTAAAVAPAGEPMEPCCECGEYYPRTDLIRDGFVFCPKCRKVLSP